MYTSTMKKNSTVFNNYNWAQELGKFNNCSGRNSVSDASIRRD